MKILALVFASLLGTSTCLSQTTGSNVFFTSATQWQIPTGVTTITIEAWGAGGGGSPFSGGQGGGYFKAILPVTPVAAGVINSININIGNGGAGCTAASINGVTGGDTTVTYSLNAALGAVTLLAGGGTGSNFAGATAGSVGTFSTSAPKKFYFRGFTGQFGATSKTVATTLFSAGSPATATVPATFPSFYVSAVGGDGGESGNSSNTHGAGGSEYVLVSQTASVFTPYTYTPVFKRGLQQFGVNGVNGTLPGGGGGGAPNVSLNVACGSGANGLVIFTW